ncbi:MAG: branched-chain amino acid ABC transporter permease [Clostridiales bacterium]|nr:branched-chain amino acid ABC transporter permease [Clostridiales bacterium]
MEDKTLRKEKNPLKNIIILVIVAFFASLTLWGNAYFINLLTLLFLYLSLAQMWNLLAGYSGLVSLGQQIFVGLGGYCLAIMTEKYHQGLALSLVVAVAVCVAFAFVISFPIFKMRGVYFTIGTWIVAEALMIFFANWSFANYNIGYNIRMGYTFSPNIIYLMAYIIGIGSVALVFFLLRTKTGLALMSMRDNESAAEVRGVKLYGTKLRIFLLTAGYTGLTGAVLYLNMVYLTPDSAFTINWTVSMVFMVIIGGMGTIEGGIIGAVVYVIIQQYLYNFPGISMIILGAAAIAIILFLPKGIMGTLHSRYGWELFSVRRGLQNKGASVTSLKDILMK